MVNELKKDENLLKPEKVDEAVVAPPSKPEPTKETETPKDTVEIKKDTLDALLSRVERLEKAGNKKRLDHYDRLNDEDSETIYKLRVIDGKVIVRWSDLHTNKAEVDPVSKKIIENQTLTVYYEDDKEETMSLIMFNRRYEHIFATLKEETILKDKEKKAKYGNRIFKVKTEEGQTYEIGEKFIN